MKRLIATYGGIPIYSGESYVKAPPLVDVDVSGGDITYDGDYAIITFTEDGSISFMEDYYTGNIPDVSILLVGGGGAGAGFDAQNYKSGSGGGGGEVVETSISPLAGDYSIIVGAGGDGDTTQPGPGIQNYAEWGYKSELAGPVSIDASGGQGALWPTSNPVIDPGKSGDSGSGFTGLEYTGEFEAPGGAGDSQNGQSGTSGGGINTGGDGGNGSLSSLSGTEIGYGGGGSGSGLNAYGDASYGARSEGSGIANRGGGGSGRGENTGSGNGYSGGSGIVIIRYKYK